MLGFWEGLVEIQFAPLEERVRKWSHVHSSLDIGGSNLTVVMWPQPFWMVLGSWEGVEQRHLLASHP